MSLHLIDSHLHLSDYPLSTDIAGVVDLAESVGVKRMVCNGTSEKDWPKVLRYAEAHPQVIPCLGLHPWFVKNKSEKWLLTLDEMVGANACGVGEIGLDKLDQPFDRMDLEEAFRAQLDIARRHHRPVTIHCVRAWGWLLDVMKSEPELPDGFLVHAFGGSSDMVKQFLDMGACFSFSGAVLRSSYEKARAALKVVPSDRLLIETDSPNMLPPEPFRPYCVVMDKYELNHPANLPEIMKGIAELLGKKTNDLMERLWENSVRFFHSMLADGS